MIANSKRTITLFLLAAAIIWTQLLASLSVTTSFFKFLSSLRVVVPNMNAAVAFDVEVNAKTGTLTNRSAPLVQKVKGEEVFKVEFIEVIAQQTDAESYPPASPSSTPPPPPIRTLGFFDKRFYSGFRNEGMVFTWFVMYAVKHNFQEILLETINWKDLYGTGKKSIHAPHSLLFDVEHWNSFHPALPRLVHYDPTLHSDFDGSDHRRLRWTVDNPLQNATRPYAYGIFSQCFTNYKKYTSRLLQSKNNKNPNNRIRRRDPAEVLMMQGAFRPSPDLRQHMDKLVHDDAEMMETPYLALHARVEPDMQNHPVCRRFKVLSLKDIVHSLERQFPEPPLAIQKVFIAINRPMLERVVADPKIDNRIAEENLVELNRISRDGLWNGSVPVFEAGMPYILNNSQSPSLKKYAGISGAVLDYFLAKQAQVFVGTEVSSFSMDLIQSRFFSHNRQNYLYRPDGALHLATLPEAEQPPRFSCR